METTGTTHDTYERIPSWLLSKTPRETTETVLERAANHLGDHGRHAHDARTKGRHYCHYDYFHDYSYYGTYDHGPQQNTGQETKAQATGSRSCLHVAHAGHTRTCDESLTYLVCMEKTKHAYLVTNCVCGV